MIDLCDFLLHDIYSGESDKIRKACLPIRHGQQASIRIEGMMDAATGYPEVLFVYDHSIHDQFISTVSIDYFIFF